MGAEQSLAEQTDPHTPFSRLLPRSNAPTGGVVVVSGPSSSGQNVGQQTEIDKLNKIPLFSPFIRSSVNLFGFESNSIDGTSSSAAAAAASPNSALSSVTPMLDSRALASISTRLQEHLRQCAEAVAFDQNALCNRMNDVDLSIAATHSCLSERHRRYTRLREQLAQTRDLCSLLAKVKTSVDQAHRGLYDLNKVLPADLQVNIPEVAIQKPSGERSRSGSATSNSLEVPSNKRPVFDAIASSVSSTTSSLAHHQDDTDSSPPTPSPTPAVETSQTTGNEETTIAESDEAISSSQ